MFRYIIFILAILITSSAFADERIVGYMPPLPEEMLTDPITLDCGLTINEVRGGSLDVPRLNSMCMHAYDNFFKFIETKGLKTNHNNPFVWNISFLPEATCYRCLNDEKYRFKYRYVHGAVIGYTDKNQQYIFMFVDNKDREFKTTYVHELFHAMSMYYGVYDNHPGGWSTKTAADEKLARGFTEWLGYGR